METIYDGAKTERIGLLNKYGFDKHKLVDKVEGYFEYAGRTTLKGVAYDCYLVPDGNCYDAVCVKVEK